MTEDARSGSNFFHAGGGFLVPYSNYNAAGSDNK
jgi:hypothetical protein